MTQTDQKANSKASFLGILLGVIVFMRTMPCYFWSVENILRPICAILVLIICVFNISKDKQTLSVFLCLAAAYVWAVLFVDHSGIITLLNWLAFAFIPILRKELVYETYRVFRAIIIFFLICSIVNYVFVRTGWLSSGIVIDPINKLKRHRYIMYPFLVIVEGSTSWRFRGIWDEPGVIGTICGLLLVAERMDLKKKGNLIVFISGLLSVSFFFYVALFWGLILFSTKLTKRWVYIVLVSMVAFATYNNKYLYNNIWYRFEWDAEEGQFVGDNRNGSGLKAHFESIQGTKAFFIGEGTSVATEYYGASSLYLIIVKHGFIFVALNLLGYSILSWREIKKKREWIAFFLFFIATLYQRPGFYDTSSIFLYTMVIYTFASKDDFEEHSNPAEPITSAAGMKVIPL